MFAVDDKANTVTPPGWLQMCIILIHIGISLGDLDFLQGSNLSKYIHCIFLLYYQVVIPEYIILHIVTKIHFRN